MQVDVASHGHEILPIRSPIIESAGEPQLRAQFHPMSIWQIMSFGVDPD
jgi:hypothetical protein